jgi:hypothetical protein
MYSSRGDSRVVKENIEQIVMNRTDFGVLLRPTKSEAIGGWNGGNELSAREGRSLSRD